MSPPLETGSHEPRAVVCRGPGASLGRNLWPADVPCHAQRTRSGLHARHPHTPQYRSKPHHVHVFIICGCVCVCVCAHIGRDKSVFFFRGLWPGRIPPNAAISHLHAAPWASRLNAPPCVRGGRPWRERPHHHIFRSVLGPPCVRGGRPWRARPHHHILFAVFSVTCR